MQHDAQKQAFTKGKKGLKVRIIHSKSEKLADQMQKKGMYNEALTYKRGEAVVQNVQGNNGPEERKV